MSSAAKGQKRQTNRADLQPNWPVGPAVHADNSQASFRQATRLPRSVEDQLLLRLLRLLQHLRPHRRLFLHLWPRLKVLALQPPQDLPIRLNITTSVPPVGVEDMGGEAVMEEEVTEMAPALQRRV